MKRFVAAAALIAFASSACGAARITSGFGYRSDPFKGTEKMHAGMDMAAPMGTPIYATGDGYVGRAGWTGGYGNMIALEHGYGYESRYGHLSRILVPQGAFVRRGQLIGLMGSTGHSTGSHLHYEVRIGGAPVDPTRYMQIVFTTAPDWATVPRVSQLGSGARTASISWQGTARSGSMGPRSPGYERLMRADTVSYSQPQSGYSQSGSSGFDAGHVGLK